MNLPNQGDPCACGDVETWHSECYRRTQDPDPQALAYAKTLAVAIHAKHYADVKHWQPLDTVIGLLTQIDNMTSGLVKGEKA